MNILNNLTKIKIKALFEEPNYTPGDLIDHDGVGAIIRNKSNQILLQDHVKYNFWTIPIGKAEKGQTPEEGLKQELFEELGIEVIKCKLIKVTKRTYVRNNNPINMNENLFEIIKYKGTPQNLEPHKHRSIKWFSLNEIKQLTSISDMTKSMLEVYK